jgi:hypothetical protein
MKTFGLTTIIVVFLLVYSNGISAQVTTSNLDQIKGISKNSLLMYMPDC